MAASRPLALLATADAPLWNSISRTLSTLGLRVKRAVSGQDALALCEREDLRLVVLDLRMPGIAGLDVCRGIRQRSAAPLIVLGIERANSVAVAALDQGADEYLALPCDAEALLARARAVLRRSQGAEQQSQQDLLRFGELEIDLIGRRLCRAGCPIRLTKIEWALLGELARHPGQVLTHQALLRRVWGDSYGEEREYLHTYVRRLRRKLEDDPANPRYLLNAPGIGYRFASQEPQSTPPPAAPATTPTAPAAPASASEAIHPSNLPALPNRLIGREREVAAACSITSRTAG